MRPILRLLAIVSLAGAQPVWGATRLCEVLGRFEATVPSEFEHPHEGRWIEFHWGFDHSPDAMWSWGCRHSNQQIAGQTCAWLKDNANQEFAMMLPQGIMACYGYHFPSRSYYDWAGMAGTIALHGRNGNRLRLDLNYRDLPRGEVAMRLSVEAKDGDSKVDELPPIAAMPVK